MHELQLFPSHPYTTFPTPVASRSTIAFLKSPKSVKMVTCAYCMEMNKSIEAVFSRRFTTLCGSPPCQKIEDNVTLRIRGGDNFCAKVFSYVKLKVAAPNFIYGGSVQNKASPNLKPCTCAQSDHFLKRKASFQSEDPKRWQKEAEIDGIKSIKTLRSWNNLKFFRGVNTKGDAFTLFLNVLEGLGIIRKNFTYQAVGASLAMLVMGLAISPQPCFALFHADSPASTVNLQDREELFPLPSEFPPLREMSLPIYEKIVLPNGLRVFLLEDHELGLVGGQLLVKGGNKDDPVEKLGLAGITSIVQRSGGSTEHPADVLDVKLEAMAARIETSSSVSQMSVSFKCLTEDLFEVISLFSEVIQEPVFPKDKLELTRTQFLGAIDRRGDNPQGITAREFPKLLYGNGSKFARYPLRETISAVSQEDLVAFHRQIFRPNASVLGIWGDFDKSMVKDAIEHTFGGWNVMKVEDNTRALVDINLGSELEIGSSVFEPNVYTIDRPGLSQGFVRMGELGTTLADPDVFALDLLNDILNGFGGLLFDQVRSREGLAYSVSGGWTPAVEHRGVFLAGGETRLESVPQFVQTVKQVLKGVTQAPPTEEMLARAKEGAINSFVFNFVDSGTQLARIMIYELFGIDQDFIFNYKKKVEELTSNDILQAAQRHLHPEFQPILIVTDVSKLKPLLESLKIETLTLQPDYLIK